VDMRNRPDMPTVPVTKLRLTPEARERRRTEELARSLRAIGDAPISWNAFQSDAPPTDKELDAIADACNEILNGIDEWLDDREDARMGSRGERPQSAWNKRSTVNKRARKPSNKK
jgi:hypothetical protein